MPQKQTERSITGDDIISELLRNMDAGLFKVRYSVIAPAVYQVYLHPSDYDFLKPVMPHLIAECKRALQEKIIAYNNAARPSSLARRLGLDSGKEVEYKILDSDWTIQLYPDHEEKLQRGDIEIYSELGSEPRAEYGEGAMTRLVTKKSPEGESTSRQTKVEADVPRTSETVYGHIRYTTTSGPQSFPVTKNQVVIGRGGKSFWVDLKIEEPADISREHCRLRRDPATGRFYLKDVSQFGTTVDGNRVPSSLESRQGETLDSNIEVALPRKSVIGLADVVYLEFEST